MKFTEHMRALIDARSHRPELCGIFRYSSKLSGRELAQRLGLRVPELIAGPFQLDAAPPDPCRSIVLKPNSGCSGRGVLPLSRGPDGYRCLWPDVRRPDALRGDWHSWEAWLRQAAALEHAWEGEQAIAGPWLAEQLVTQREGGELSFVWKFYCIHGRPVWVRQLEALRRRGGRVCCWTFPARLSAARAWDALDFDVFTNHTRQAVANLPAPMHADALVEAATAVAHFLQEQTGSPFVRVDLLEDEKGPVFGEITPHPSGGQDAYQPDFDEELGRMWSDGP